MQILLALAVLIYLIPTTYKIKGKIEYDSNSNEAKFGLIYDKIDKIKPMLISTGGYTILDSSYMISTFKKMPDNIRVSRVENQINEVNSEVKIAVFDYLTEKGFLGMDLSKENSTEDLVYLRVVISLNTNGFKTGYTLSLERVKKILEIEDKKAKE